MNPTLTADRMHPLLQWVRKRPRFPKKNQTFHSVFKPRNSKYGAPVQRRHLQHPKVTMEPGKLTVSGEEQVDEIYMNLADEDLFHQDPMAAEGNEEMNLRPSADPVLPTMDPVNDDNLSHQPRVTLSDIGIALRQAGYSTVGSMANWAGAEDEEGEGGVQSPGISELSVMEIDATSSKDGPHEGVGGDPGFEPSKVRNDGEAPGPSMGTSSPQKGEERPAGLESIPNGEMTVPNLLQPTEDVTPGKPKKKSLSSPQKRETLSHAQVRQQMFEDLGFEVDPDSGNPQPQMYSKAPSGGCGYCGGRQSHGFQLHLLECPQATKVRSTGKARPFETKFPFLEYVRLPEERWLTKLAPELEGEQNLTEFMRLAVPSSQEVHRTCIKLFNRVATEFCDPNKCFGSFLPVMAETYSFIQRLKLDPDEQYNHLAQIHNVWRDHKRLAYEFLQLVQGGNGFVDCLQFDYCCSNQLRSEIASLLDRSLTLNEGMQILFNGLGYLAANQQSLAQTMMSSWEQDLSRCRYLLALIKRRRVIIDCKKATWYNLGGPSQELDKEGGQGESVGGSDQPWQFVQRGRFEQVAVQSKLSCLKGNKQKATKGQTVKSQPQGATRERDAPSLANEEMVGLDQLPSLGREAQQELHRVLLALTQPEGKKGQRERPEKGPTTARPEARQAQTPPRSPVYSKREWKSERRESVSSHGSGSRGQPPKGHHGYKESSHRGGVEKRRPRSRSQDEAALEYSREGASVFKRVGGYKKKNKRGQGYRANHHQGG